MSFIASARIGRIGEGMVRDVLDWAGVDTSLNAAVGMATLKQCDILCVLNGLRFSVESKFDSMESKTKNLAIEFANPRTNKPSGLMVTTSDIWAVVLKDPTAVWICKTEDLKSYFESEPPIKVIVRAGDGNASLKLFNSEKILGSIFHRIDNEPPWEVLSKITTLLSGEKTNVRPILVADSLQNLLSKKRATVEYRDTTC